MESLSESIELDVDEPSELEFKVRIEGTSGGSPAKTRLVIEGTDANVMVEGTADDDPSVVTFVVPKLSGRMTEGAHRAYLEVVVENRYFVPIRFSVDVKKTVTVVAEAVRVMSKKKQATVSVVAEAMPSKKPVIRQAAATPAVKPIVKPKAKQSELKRLYEEDVKRTRDDARDIDVNELIRAIVSQTR